MVEPMSPAGNFTLQDLLSTAVASALFPLFLLLPGYALGWILNVLRFREQTPLICLLLSLPLSLALTPAIIFLMGRALSMQSVGVFYLLVWVALLVILATRRFSWRRFPSGVLKPVVLISAAWILTVSLSLADLQIGRKLFFSAVGYDYTVRSGSVGQLAHALWLPPSNPFFFPGHAAAFRYHYFWFLVCSLPVRLTHGLVGPRAALIAGVIWIGFTLMATVAVYLRFFSSAGPRRIRERTLLALGLLCVSGLDIVPTLLIDVSGFLFHKGSTTPSVDWWNHDQVTGWLDSTFWVPHHLAGAIACLTGFLILWFSWGDDSRKWRWQSVAAAALAFASAVGLSVYVAIVFAGCLAVWTGLEMFRKNLSRVADLAVAGVSAALLSAPYCLDLLGAGSSGNTGPDASFARLAIREFTPAHMLMTAIRHTRPWELQLVDFAMLPLNFLLELGIFFVIGFIQIRRWKSAKWVLGPADFGGLVLSISSLVFCLFVRSNTIETNDLGMRGMLIVQFFLVLWGVDVLFEWRLEKVPIRWISYALGITLVIGLSTTAAELALLRGYTWLTDAGLTRGENLIVHGDHFAERTFASREAYDWLAGHVPEHAVEEANPFPGYYDLIPGLYSSRQMAMTDSTMAISFGADPREVATAVSWMHRLFDNAAPPAEVDRLCTLSGINFLIATSRDPIWRDAGSWVWSRKPVFAGTTVRAVSCGTTATE
jgi:hypothetical protein